MVHRRFQPPDHDRHHRSSENISRPHPLPEIFHEAGADLGAYFGAGLVGAGLSFYEAVLFGTPEKKTASSGQRCRGNPESLREVQGPARIHHELC